MVTLPIIAALPPSEVGRAQLIRLPAGQDTTLAATCFASDGVSPLDLTGGALITNVRKVQVSATADDGIIIAREATISIPATAGLATVLITSADTILVTPGQYVWDLWFIDSSGNRSRVVEASPFVLLEAITNPAGPVTVPVGSPPLAQGPKGDKGDKGDTGATGAVGPAPSGNAGDLVILASSGVAASRSPSLGYCVDFPGAGGAHCQINHGFFWPAPPSEGGPSDLGQFFWEFLCMPRNAGSTYMMSDGAGGQHAALLGFVQGGTGASNQPSGNFNGSVGCSFQAAEGLLPGEWGCVAYHYDPVTGHVFLFINGIIAGIVSCSGTRYAAATVLGRGRRLYVGGSDHSNFDGRIQMYRCIEGGDGPFQMTGSNPATCGYNPERVFRSQFWDGQAEIREANLLCDLTYPARVVADLSGGAPSNYTGTIHSGSFHAVFGQFPNDGMPGDYGPSYAPLAQWVLDSNSPLYSLVTGGPAKQPSLYPNSSPPGSAILFDSFGGGESSFFYDLNPSLGNIQYSTVGTLAWQYTCITGYTLTIGSTWGKRANSAICLNGNSVPAVATYVISGSLPSDVDLRVSRYGNLSNQQGIGMRTGMVFRVVDNLNYWFCYSIDPYEIHVGTVQNGIITTVPIDVSNSATVANWTILRIVAKGSTITLYVDDTLGSGGFTQVAQITDSTFQTGKGVGLWDSKNINSGAHIDQTPRYKNFTLFAAP